MLPKIPETRALFSERPLLIQDFVGKGISFLLSDEIKKMGVEKWGQYKAKKIRQKYYDTKYQEWFCSSWGQNVLASVQKGINDLVINYIDKMLGTK